jgi:hypothetical protein
MTETYRSRAFGDSEALDWLRSRPDGRVTASAAELGRQWGWNRMRPGRRLRTWQEAGSIRRNTDEIIVTTSVTPNVTAAVGVTARPEAAVTRRSMTPVKLAVLIVAFALACVSATISNHGLTAIFAGAFWSATTMGAALEAKKLVGDAWPIENWHSTPSPPAPDPRGGDRLFDVSKRIRWRKPARSTKPRSLELKSQIDCSRALRWNAKWGQRRRVPRIARKPRQRWTGRCNWPMVRKTRWSTPRRFIPSRIRKPKRV